jgi:hypothetical protein
MYDLKQTKMQRAIQAIGSHGSVLKSAVLKHVSLSKPAVLPAVFPRFMSVSSAQIEESGFESGTIADILKSKGKSADGSWLWCTTDDTVYDAVKSVRFPTGHISRFIGNFLLRVTKEFEQMTQHNVGALVVVKPGQDKSIAGIVTERGKLLSI